MKLIQIIFIIIVLVLLFCLMKVLKLVSKMKEALTHVEEGNLNQRIRFHTSFKSFNSVGDKINNLVTKLQETEIRKKYLEEDRKRMISNISHDLRTPLTSLLGYLEAVNKDGTLTEEEKERYLLIAYSKATDLHKLLEEFFELSKLDASDIKLNIESNDIVDIVQEALASFYEDFINNGLKPNIAFSSDKLMVLCDKMYVQRIMLNLLSNAIKYGSDGNYVELSINAEGDFAFVSISNGGKGIPEEDLPHVFDRLYTTDKSRNFGARGSGIGLAVSKKLVELQKGKITAESIPNERTTFSFSLPRVKKE